jgi:hypothetical protein
MEKIKHFLNNLFGSYSKGEIAGYYLGYTVAKEEYSVKYDVVINIYDDFHQFQQEIKDEYGTDYLQKTEQYFAQFANLREPLQAYLVAHKSHAKLLQNYQVDGYRIIHLINKLTSLYMNLDDRDCLGKAKSYAKLGLNLLNQDEPYYNSLIRIFSGFRQKVMDKEWVNN